MREEAATVDFETEPIRNRPEYPPRPVGVAIRRPGGKRKYYAWGHPDGNNCHVETAREELRDHYRNSRVIFHNSPFDLDVGEVHLGLRPPAHRVEDTLYLSFLKDPYEETIALKPLGEKYLGMPPEERDAVRDWIIDNIPAAKKKPSTWGDYICVAPPSLVGPYARDDVERTFRLHEKFLPEITERGMRAAYERELALTEVTLEMERSGVRVDVPRITEAIIVFEKFEAKLRQRIEKRLNVGPDFNDKGDGKKYKPFNLGSGQQLARALIDAEKLDALVKTASGKNISTKISVLQETCNDKRLLNLLAVHSVVKKYLSSFLYPWLEQAEITGGRVLPSFNQVRARTEDGGGGARSGRFSSNNPNLQQISANVEESKNKEVLLLMQKWLKELYDYDFIGLRDFFLPDEGCIIIAADYSQQELRLLAHFDTDGSLRDAYLRDPKLDVHEYIGQLIYKMTGMLYERKFIKIAVFGIIYGMGVGKLADMLGEPTRVAKAIKAGIFKAVPGIGNLMDDLKRLARKDEPLITWGGRQYFCEEPRYVKKYDKWMSFEYKMLNYQIQPSAADVTKQGMLNVREQVPEARIAIQVHDELVCMAPSAKYAPKITKAMCDMKFNVPMLAEAKCSTLSWARVA